MLPWQDATIAGFDHEDFPELLRLSYELESFVVRRRFLDHARGVARTDRERRAIERADRAILRDSWEDLAERVARKTAERESLAATIDQSGESYAECVCGNPEHGVGAFEITDQKSWPVFLPSEVRDKLFEIEYIDDRLRVLRRELQLRPTAAERNVTEWPWE
jgi:hypothetical protein